MASFSRKNLVCFYCNKSSNVRYDGFITHWDCEKCDATNYLDENGEITDPPVATSSEAAPADSLKYATARTRSPGNNSESALFCPTCLKNQHLYTSSLAQYHIEIETDHPRYRELERRYYAFRKDLEKRYPQVCEDCEPKVRERMKIAVKTARSDWLRRMMDKSQARRSGAKAGISLLDCILAIGKALWFAGALGQLLWNMMALMSATFAANLGAMDTSAATPNLALLVPHIPAFVSSMTTTTWAEWILFCSVSSAWWNPKFKEMNNGFSNHIIGFGEWYKYQVVILVSRILFYYTVGIGVLKSSSSSATAATHLVMLVFSYILSIGAMRCIVVDTSQLWKSTPTYITNIGPGSASPEQAHSTNAMANVLNDMMATPSLGQFPQSPIFPTRYDPEQQARPSSAYNRRPQKFQTARHFPAPNRDDDVRQQDDASSPSSERMDWTPTSSTARRHEFVPTVRPTQKPVQVAVEPQLNPFRMRVPEAPYSPAHRLRNPPNQPRLQVASEERKKNFFNNMTQRSPAEDKASDSSQMRADISASFSRQTFFPSKAENEAESSLADLLTSISLGPSEPKKVVGKKRRHSRPKHIWQGIVLVGCLFFWNYAFVYPFEYSKNVTKGLLMLCMAMGTRTILDNSLLGEQDSEKAGVRTFGLFFGFAECSGAAYGLLEGVSGKADLGECASVGTLLMSGMLVYEMCLAFFVD